MHRFLPPPQVAIWRQPWQQRRTPGEHLGLLLTLAGTSLPVLLLAQASNWLPALALVWLVVLWWNQVAALLRQNQPRLAQLVPGHYAALRRQLLIQGLVVTLLGAGCLYASTGPGPWLLMVGLSVVLLAWMVCEPTLFWPIYLFPVWLALLDSWNPNVQISLNPPFSIQALTFGAYALLLAACVARNGTTLQRRHARERALQAAARAAREGRPDGHQAPWVRRLESLFDWPQALHRAALVRRADPRTVLARLDHVLSRNGHWASQLWIFSIFLMLLVGTLVSLLLLLPKAPPWDEIGQGARLGLSIGPFSFLLSAPLIRARMLWGTRREQALLVLLPGVPQGAQQAQALALYWGRQHLALWSLGSAMLLGLLAVSHPPSLVYGTAYVAACLPLGLLQGFSLLRARTQGPGWVDRIAPFLPALMALPALGAERIGLPPALSLGASVLLSALGAQVLWRGLRQAPLPAGRQTYNGSSV
ncbi:hypothetical protein [Inhella gelatinilytica]|uniref:Uncharacterized protein n=1 Tax=Inhella gelatinilytica TaxID=2795030 RepID=A0A931IWW3_9BURK|nr:hypothetical protein [Inhella gelatinilytica]MBH9553644.1 hypothetical protein [Inhella gelatinilytica]